MLEATRALPSSPLPTPTVTHQNASAGDVDDESHTVENRVPVKFEAAHSASDARGQQAAAEAAQQAADDKFKSYQLDSPFSEIFIPASSDDDVLANERARDRSESPIGYLVRESLPRD
jgi:hypothetical protein